MPSSYAYCATLNNSDLDNSLNIDTSQDSKLDFDNDMPLLLQNFYTTKDKLFDAI
jgi:hypothetical protein